MFRESNRTKETVLPTCMYLPLLGANDEIFRLLFQQVVVDSRDDALGPRHGYIP